MAATLVKSGTFNLRIDTDGATSSYGSSSHQGSTSFQGLYGIRVPADLVPFIVVPLSSSTNGKTAGKMIGYMALVVDNNKKTSTYAMVGDAGPAKNGWGEVSLKCAWNLGYSKNEANGSRGPVSNFSIYVDTSSKPSWKGNYTNVNSMIQSEGKARFGSTNLGYNTNTSYGAAVSGTYVDKSQINYDYLNYYIITLDRYSPSINHKSLMNNNVAGAIIEAGYLYNSAHVQVSNYRNPKLEDQCLACSKANMPFGLYCDAKARTKEEAVKEIYQLSFCIRKYPPMLGMWVHFQLVKSKSVNDSIVSYYKDELIRLGLKDHIGILATTSELSKISWKEKHYKDWYLWLNKHISSANDVNQLLTPELFVV